MLKAILRQGRFSNFVAIVAMGKEGRRGRGRPPASPKLPASPAGDQAGDAAGADSHVPDAIPNGGGPPDRKKAKQVSAVKQQLMEDNMKNNACNAAIHQQTLTSYENIKTLKPEIFWDLDQVLPQEIVATGNGGAYEVGSFQNPYKPAEHKIALESGVPEAVYRCGLPLSMISITYSPTPGVQINPGQIKQIKQTKYEKPHP